MLRLRIIDILFAILIGMGLMGLTPAEVTNDEIRGTIQSLIYSYNQLDNKLERHEHRERALGELMKKAMQSLQKGQKNLEPISGIFGRLDERVSQIETMLITQEEKYNAQTDKFGQTLEHIFKWMRDNDECFRRPPVAVAATTPAPSTSAPATLIYKEFVEQQQKMTKEIVDEIKQLSRNVGKQLENTQGMITRTEVAVKNLPSTTEVLSKIEDKLVTYMVAPVVTAAPPPDNSEFEQKVLELVGDLKHDLTEMRTTLNNETLTALETLKTEALTASEKALASAAKTVQRVQDKLTDDLAQLNTGVVDSSHLLQRFFGEMNSSFAKMNDGLEIFNKFNNIMMSNSEYVLDTQRKVEFGTLQVVQKISQLLEQQNADLGEMLKARFDIVDESIINTQFEATKNVSNQIESELGQVWRRIEIMTGELIDSTELLKLMQTSQEANINTTFSTMIGLSTKVEETKGRMLDMDQNLNYLLGKLSLMSSEFNQIKKGLSDSLDELRKSFQMLQGQLPTGSDSDKNKYHTDVNLLSKRHATN